MRPCPLIIPHEVSCSRSIKEKGGDYFPPAHVRSRHVTQLFYLFCRLLLFFLAIDQLRIFIKHIVHLFLFCCSKLAILRQFRILCLRLRKVFL